MKKKPAKKRVSRSSRPVLTSPWKIGILVSLLLVFVGFGVGGYFVSLYRIRFTWIGLGPHGVRFDSLGFFQEMYPLVAVLTIVSLVAYFLVASSVRRYKCYLDSGQDYRKMISLAESIDDLTNPAQIARLSSYPELQGVLRAYGDQIRDIAQDLGGEQGSLGVDELERDVEALLGGGIGPKTSVDSKPYGGVLRRIMQRLAADRAKVDELAKQSDADRQAMRGAALACGRVVEAASGAGDEIMEMARTISDLDRIAHELDAGGPQSAPAESRSPDSREAAGAKIEGAARKLENGSALLQELSDENDSVAIALALMAAKGNADGHELASFADRVRVTAERFHRLGATIESIAKGLLGACYALKEPAAASAAASPPSAPDSRSLQAIFGITEAMEQRSAKLRDGLCNLGNELHELQELLQGDLKTQSAGAETASFGAEEPAAAAATPEEPGSVRVTGSFVIDHGSAWGGMSGSGAEAAQKDAEPAPETCETPHEECATRPKPPEASEPGDFSDMSSLRDLDREGAAREDESAARENESAVEDLGGAGESPSAADGGWMEMPGHRWLKIDVNKSELEEDRPVDVTVESSSPTPEPQRSAPPEDAEDGDPDPVYDLGELGAVEYSEEIGAER